MRVLGAQPGGRLPIVLSMLGLGGCTSGGAPSFILFGAYFPAWMLCGAVGIAAAIAARTLFVATGLAQILPFQLFVCCAVGVIVAVLVSIGWFG